MDNGDFTVEGWDEFTASFAKMVTKWDEKKRILLQRIGLMMQRYIEPKIPVDTSRLADSFFTEVDGDSVEYATNVHYAIYVDEGHVQHRRFLPIKYISVGGRAKYVKDPNAKGIMLKERYVPGVHFVDKGMAEAMPHIDNLVNSFMDEIFKEAMGSTL